VRGGHVTPEWVLQRNLRLARANLFKPEGAESAPILPNADTVRTQRETRTRTDMGHFRITA